jgi:hypothetical protein
MRFHCVDFVEEVSNFDFRNWSSNADPILLQKHYIYSFTSYYHIFFIVQI